MDDDIIITEDTADQGDASATAPDAGQPDIGVMVQQQVAAALAPLLERLQAPPQTAEQAKPRDPFLAALHQELGAELPEDVTNDLAKARAFAAIRDEYGDNADVLRAIDQRTRAARPIELIASTRRDLQQLRDEINQERDALEQARQAQSARERLVQDLQSEDSKIRKLYPNVFGRPSKAHEKLLQLPISTLDQVLPAFEALAADIARQHRPMTDFPTPGADMSDAGPKKFYSGDEYTRAIESLLQKGEVH